MSKLEEKFDKFVENDFLHLKTEVFGISKDISFIRGQLWVIPIVVSVVGLLVGLVTSLIVLVV